MARLSPDFPGSCQTGALFEDEASQRRFIDFGNDEVCPALDPATGLCDLYSSRPLTCRAFGPPVRTEEGLGHCELCFQGATEAQITASEMLVDPLNKEAELLQELGQGMVTPGQTIVSFSLVTIPTRKS